MMYIEIFWNEETGEGELTDESWQTIIDYLSIENEGCQMPITVLDFLQDAAGITEEKYNHVLASWHQKIETDHGEGAMLQ
ncbi:MAG: hypothetical protein GY749_22845 [Desulfobacteraceae bacterium]|nr:hypothetical protein [Desulfobacteraceae bacterium]